MRLLLVLLLATTPLVARPNIVFIIADDLGYGEPGCYGGTEIPTPHIDSLAASGARFTNGYVTAPYCAASRAALLTGRYQTSFGFEFNPIAEKNLTPGIGLPVDQETIADRLRSAGYATSLVGKWHLGGTAPFHPQRRGFDEFFGFLHEGHFFVPPPWKGVTTWLRRETLPNGERGRWTSADGRIIWSTHMGNNEHPYDTDNPILRQSQPVEETENLTDAFTREARDFITRHKSQPFFLCLSYNAVHSPLQAPDAYMEKFSHIPDIQRRIFAGMLSHMDDGIGEVLACLRENGIEQNTMVVFLSDNGGPTKELTSSNAPLKGGKGQLWEGGIRVPFLVSWKGHNPAGQVIDTPVSALDLAPTCFSIAEAPEGKQPLHGRNFLHLLLNPSDPPEPRAFYWRMGPRNALREGKWKLIRDKSDWQLFDLENDISETTDLATSHSELVSSLADKWETWSNSQAEPLWK